MVTHDSIMVKLNREDKKNCKVIRYILKLPMYRPVPRSIFPEKVQGPKLLLTQRVILFFVEYV